MESNANTDVDKLIAFGQMAFEQGWYDQARDYFRQALELGPSNREAMKGLAQAEEMLGRGASFEPTEPEVPLAKPARKGHPIAEWLRRVREEEARVAAERERLAAEKREERAREIARQAEGVLMTAKGGERVLELLEDKIRIRWEGGVLGRGTKEISLKNITAIELEKAGRIFGGKIVFSHPGGLELFETGIGSCVVFNREQQPDFERIKAEIEKRIQAKSVPSAPSSDADEIAKLADLRDKGILTEEEFQQKKKQILGL
jgi:hypothetical protein